MSNRALLTSVTTLCGVTLKQIAEATGVPIARIREASKGWPLRDLHQEPLNAYAKWLLRGAYTTATKQMHAIPELRRHPKSQSHVRALADAYRAAFSIDLLDDCEVSK